MLHKTNSHLHAYMHKSIVIVYTNIYTCTHIYIYTQRTWGGTESTKRMLAVRLQNPFISLFKQTYHLLWIKFTSISQLNKMNKLYIFANILYFLVWNMFFDGSIKPKVKKFKQETWESVCVVGCCRNRCHYHCVDCRLLVVIVCVCVCVFEGEKRGMAKRRAKQTLWAMWTLRSRQKYAIEKIL